MTTDNGDELVPFQDVRVVKSVAAALLCRIGGRTVWLQRWHTSGKLWRTGDRGKLFIRRWVARDQNLIDAQGAGIQSVSALSRLPAALPLVRRDRDSTRGE